MSVAYLTSWVKSASPAHLALKYTPWQAAPVFWEGSKFQGIHWALSDDAGATWSSPRLLVSAFQNLPIWAPVLHIQVTAAQKLCKAAL